MVVRRVGCPAVRAEGYQVFFHGIFFPDAFEAFSRVRFHLQVARPDQQCIKRQAVRCRCFQSTARHSGECTRPHPVPPRIVHYQYSFGPGLRGYSILRCCSGNVLSRIRRVPGAHVPGCIGLMTGCLSGCSNSRKRVWSPAVNSTQSSRQRISIDGSPGLVGAL